MTHAQCPKCRRRKIVVERKDGQEVFAHHYRSGRRKGGTCPATGKPVAPLAGAA